jgi:hypothetical protein
MKGIKMNSSKIRDALKQVSETRQLRNRVRDRLDALPAEIESLVVQIDEHKRDIRDLKVLEFQGRATPAELSEMKAKGDALDIRLSEMKEEVSIGRSAMSEMNELLAQQERTAIVVGDEVSMAAYKKLAEEIGGNKKLRASILEAFGLLAYTVPGVHRPTRPDWGSHLAGIFQDPEGDEVQEGFDAAIKKYDLPV